MKYLSLELKGFKRMALNDVQYFKITMTEAIQLILGTNGSGKSSLLQEMSPLPGDPSAFYKDGYKCIKISKSGVIYTLKSMFGSTAKHSFLKDDLELNSGGTQSVQRELVRQEFNYDQEMHELVIGNEKFHSMSPARRREWFTKMSDISYDYALSIFAKFKERHRDTVGALKLARKHLVAETSKLISKAEEDKLRAEVDFTHRELTVLMEERAPLDRPIADINSARTIGYQELAVLSNRLLRMRFSAPYGSHAYGVDPLSNAVRDDWGAFITPCFTSTESVDEYLAGLREQLSAKTALLNKAAEEHRNVEITISALTRTGEAGIKELEEKRDTLRGQRAEVLLKRKLNLEGLDPFLAKSAVETIQETLTAIFVDLPSNEDRQYSTGRLQELEQKLFNEKDRLTKAQAEVVRLVAMEQHLVSHRDSNSIECPSCNHRWVVNYSVEKHDAVKTAIATQEENALAIERKISSLSSDIAANKLYRDLYVEYVRCTRNWPVLAPLWDYIAEQGYVVKAPRMALTTLDIFKVDMEVELEAVVINNSLGEILALIELAAVAGDSNLAESKQKLAECVLSIELLTRDISQLQKLYSDHADYKRQLIEGFDLSRKISDLMNSQEMLTADLIEALRRDSLNHCSRQLQQSLATKQSALQAAGLQRGITAELEKRIEKLTVEEEAAKLLVKELSPTEGLIAENLLGFIRSFTGIMNALIRKVWTYPLKITECGTVSDGTAVLDYKFPLMVERHDNVVPDVAQGSSGMKEIINVAFKIVAMAHLKLTEYPLFLDEFAASFDESHRTAATATVKALMEQNKFSQLFMVSHYQAGHGSFTNAQVCVLCPSNVTVPVETHYNQHVETA